MNLVKALAIRLLFISLVVAIALADDPVRASEKVKTVAVPGGGQPMAAKTDAKGVIHLVFDSANGPQYAKSTDNGKTLSKPLALVDRASRLPGLEFNVWDMAVSPDGTVHVAMGTNAWKLKLPKEEWGYMYTRLQPGERAFEPVKNVNHKPSEGFSVAVGDNGSIAAVWMADQLYANVSSDNGSTFGSTIEIDSSINPCNCCTTSSVFAADGRLAVLYREETNNDRDMYLAFWDLEHNKATKTRVGSTPWKIDTCPMTYYSVVRDHNGFVAVWPTKGEIYFAKLDADGTQQTPKEIKTTGSSGMRTGILALPTKDGHTLIAWKKDNQLGWQLYDELGRTLGSPESAKSAGSGVAGVIAKNGDIVLFR